MAFSPNIFLSILNLQSAFSFIHFSTENFYVQFCILPKGMLRKGFAFSLQNFLNNLNVDVAFFKRCLNI